MWIIVYSLSLIRINALFQDQNSRWGQIIRVDYAALNSGINVMNIPAENESVEDV